MPLKISLTESNGYGKYLEESFRVVIENYLKTIKRHPSTIVMGVEPAEAYKHEYDFYGLLIEREIPYELHWITLRINDRVDPYASCRELTEILIPDKRVIDNLLDKHNTKIGKTM